MLISVITCTWNSEQFLDESISSVLSQDYPNIEYVFVDGGSTDTTLDRIAEVPGTKKLVRNIRGGISRAMNAGVEVATGDIVAHLHSDDFYLDQHVLSLVAKEMKNHDAGWCFGRIKRVVDGMLVSESYTAPEYSYARLLRGNFIPHPATFVRRGWMIRAGQFNHNLKYAMDYDMWLKLAAFGDPIELHEPLTAFRVHQGSLSSRNRFDAMAEDFRVRLGHCSRDPISRIEHYLRYAVRRYRARK